MVWHDYRNGLGDVYGRWLDDLGTPLGAGFRISPTSTWEQESPAVAFNPAADEYLVVWSRRLPSWEGDTCDIYGRRVAGAGDSAAFRYQRLGWVAGLRVLAGGELGGIAQDYLVVWEDGRNAGVRGVDIYGRRVGAAGPGGRPSHRRARGYRRRGWSGRRLEQLQRRVPGGVAGRTRRSRHRATDIYGRKVPGSGAIADADFRISGVAATAGEGPPSVALPDVRSRRRPLARGVVGRAQLARPRYGRLRAACRLPAWPLRQGVPDKRPSGLRRR